MADCEKKTFKVELELIPDEDGDELISAIYRRSDNHFTIVDDFDGVCWAHGVFNSDDEITSEAEKMFGETFG